MKITQLLSAFLLFLIPVTGAMAQTGKISGIITDATTGETLPGVNVAIVGTTQGAVTDVEGFYFIVGVRPGTYDLRASFIGYTPEVREGIRVNIDLTTEIDFALQEAAVGLEEVVVTSVRPVVQRDVSASVANITSEEIENLPITDVEKVIGLQAGFERGLTIRGEGGDQVQFLVDGQSTTSGRDNEPFSSVSYTAVQEMQVQTGGFNAEYGNVRSGLINVVTKEPDVNRYTVDAIVRYSPASQGNRSGVDVDGNEVSLASDRNSYWMRPLFDPDVAFTGTNNGTWDQWMQDEHMTFTGWDNLASAYNEANGTTVTGAQLQDVFAQHYLRKNLEVDVPDYEVDATISGPIPGISSYLGDLRFLASYRQTQDAFLVPFARDAFAERIAQGKLVSNVGTGMKLVVSGLYGQQQGLNWEQDGEPFLITGEQPAYSWDDRRTVGTEIQNANDLFGDFFTNQSFHLMDVDRLMLGARFTHALSPSTFYEVQLQSVTTDYFTRTAEDDRDFTESFSYLNGTINLNEEPFGFTTLDQFDQFGVGVRTAGHWGTGYDNSKVQRYSGRFDITSQVNRYAQVKAGVEYINTEYDVDYGEDDPEHPHNGDPKWRYKRQPQQAAAYAQTKLEFKGMIANLGLRLDYFHASGDWFIFTPFDRAFTAQFGLDQINETLDQEATERQVELSPRLGVSFPITDNSKLYFNYGHFRNMLNPLSLFNLQENFTGQVTGIGNPGHPMPRTVAYELGFEQNLFDTYLLRLAGYYRDLSDQPREVNFISVDDLVDYDIALPWNYSDVRGFEITLQKNRGNWVRGFVNYTFTVRKTGNFGFSRVDENRTAMNNFILSTNEHYTSKPIPEPFARFNIEILFPRDLGPQVGQSHPLGDWRINLLGEWRKGQAFTWNGQTLSSTSNTSAQRELQGNVRWRDYYNLDLRFSKNFSTRIGSAQFFLDVTNVLNLRHMYVSARRLNSSPFEGSNDVIQYMESLRLPLDTFPDADPNADLYGDDKPGDFRKPGVVYVPIIIGDLPATGLDHPLYYVPGEDKYYEWDGSDFEDADGNRVRQVLDDKAYINMPNKTHFTFMNPRNVFLGIRLSF